MNLYKKMVPDFGDYFNEFFFHCFQLTQDTPIEESFKQRPLRTPKERYREETLAPFQSDLNQAKLARLELIVQLAREHPQDVRLWKIIVSEAARILYGQGNDRGYDFDDPEYNPDQINKYLQPQT